MIPVYGGTGTSQLQTALANASSMSSLPQVLPHHPINCTAGQLRYEEDGTFSCEHASVAPEDPRTQYSLDHSLALLLIELALNL